MHDPVIMSVTSNYMVCTESLDIDSHIMLYCHSLDALPVSSFFEVFTSIISNMMHNDYIKHMIGSFVDAVFQVTVLSINLSDRPLFLV